MYRKLRIYSHRLKLGCAALLILCVSSLSAGLLSRGVENATTYATVFGTEPDKWASAWLINRHVSPGALISVHDERNNNELVDASTNSTHWFDVPGSRWMRTRDQLTYQQLLTSFAESDTASDTHTDTDPLLIELGILLHGIEQLAWTTAFSAQQEAIESNYRAMQQHFFPDRVPLSCYMQFFDAVYEGLSKDALAELRTWNNGLQQGWNLCSSVDQSPHADVVPSITIESLQRLIKNNSANIVFVDTREPAEFAARRIPGAVNMPLREIKNLDVSTWQQADLVIPYCIKDFRGYEVARRLRDLGLPNVAMMEPHGLNGWLKAGLPTEGSDVAPSQTTERPLTTAVPL